MRTTVIIVCCVLASACGGRFKPQKYPTPETLLEASKQEFRRGSFGNAKTGLSRVTLELPATDPLLAEARFILAECYFAQGDYIEAAREFRRVADEFPTHALAPEALLRAGDAGSAQWEKPELDPTQGEGALATYRELLGRFPQSPVVPRAQLKLSSLAERFAAKEYRNGLFYLRLGGFDSAIIYFRSVAANYPQSRVAGDALLKLIEAYRRIGYAEERRETCAHLRRYYPKIDGLDAACPLETSSP